jgi:uncharacterized delta-60 repeat protein
MMRINNILHWAASGIVALSFHSSSLAAPATLDGSFSGDGKLRLVTGVGSSSGNAAANYPGNKIVVAGQCEVNAGDKDFCVWRINENGSPDNTFSGNGSQVFNVSGNVDKANAIAVQQDGRIVMAGICTLSGTNDFCVARLMPDGSLDNSFDNNGRLATDINGDDVAQAIAIRRDGGLVVAGTCKSGTNDSDFCIARYLANGSLDVGFFGGQGYRTLDMYGQDDELATLLVQTDNRAVLAGSCKPSASANKQFCVARLFASGQPDTSFDSDGKRAIDAFAGSTHTLGGAALQPDGKIVLGGTCAATTIRLFCAVRLTSDGSNDASFGNNGVAILLNYNNDAYVQSVNVQPDGKIVLAGYCDNGSGNFDFCWDRMNPDGTRDETVGAATPVTAIGTSFDLGNAVVTTPEGKILVAGTCRQNSTTVTDLCLARYEGGPFGYRNCKLDIDGDGVLHGTVDSLIAARVAAGVRTSILINNVSFPALATRTTWATIREYLVNQCGVALLP